MLNYCAKLLSRCVFFSLCMDTHVACDNTHTVDTAVCYIYI